MSEFLKNASVFSRQPFYVGGVGVRERGGDGDSGLC